MAASHPCLLGAMQISLRRDKRNPPPCARRTYPRAAYRPRAARLGHEGPEQLGDLCNTGSWSTAPRSAWRLVPRHRLSRRVNETPGTDHDCTRCPRRHDLTTKRRAGTTLPLLGLASSQIKAVVLVVSSLLQERLMLAQRQIINLRDSHTPTSGLILRFRPARPVRAPKVQDPRERRPAQGSAKSIACAATTRPGYDQKVPCSA